MIEHSEFTNKPNLHSLTISNNISEIKKRVIEPLIKEVENNGYCEQDRFAIRLSVEEAIMNAYKHGNKSDPNKKVKVKWYVDEREVFISIKDEGEGFDPQNIPDPRTKDNLLRPSGRGLLLIKAYMTEVTFNEKCNEIRMRKIKGHKSKEIQDLKSKRCN